MGRSNLLADGSGFLARTNCLTLRFAIPGSACVDCRLNLPEEIDDSKQQRSDLFKHPSIEHVQQQGAIDATRDEAKEYSRWISCELPFRCRYTAAERSARKATTARSDGSVSSFLSGFV